MARIIKQYEINALVRRHSIVPSNNDNWVTGKNIYYYQTLSRGIYACIFPTHKNSLWHNKNKEKGTAKNNWLSSIKNLFENDIFAPKIRLIYKFKNLAILFQLNELAHLRIILIHVRSAHKNESLKIQ